jgi:beta-carotene ketolase (CrtW type)
MFTRGLFISLSVYLLWVTSLVVCFIASLPLLINIFMIFWLSFLYAGLFIQAHDGMHGLIVPKYPRLNHFLSAVFVWSYASFSYQKLLIEHHKHHANSGQIEKDPDYHDGTHKDFFHWYAHFMLHYLSVNQIIWQSLLFLILNEYIGLPTEKIILYWALPSFLSTLQLFFFGTYKPHKDGVFLDHHRARSNDFPTWLSLITCFHFGYHLEHHRSPGTPWWQLPELKRKQNNLN